MSYSPELSILMPAHNAAKTIQSAIRSLLIAAPRSAEILVFLDGCTDSTEEILRKYNSPRIKIIKSESNVGVAEALNRLIQSAQGKYLARMDADDIALPWRFFGYKRLLRNSDLVFSSQINFSKKRAFFLRQPFLIGLNNTEVSEVLLEANTLVHSSLITTKSVMTDLGGYHHVPAEDYNLWLRAIKSGKQLRKTWFPRILFRIHSAQITKSELWKQQDSESTVNRNLTREISEQIEKHGKIRIAQRIYISILRNRKFSAHIKSDGAYFLSLLDSTLWRSSTLALSLGIAAVCSIENYALYASAALATTFFQGLVEGALRMLQVSFYADLNSLARIKKLSLVVMFTCVLLLSITLAGISLLFTGTIGPLLLIAPFVLALPIMRYSTISQLVLQSASQWKNLFKYRLVAVGTGLAVLFPILLESKSILVGSCALAFGELIYVLASMKRTKEALQYLRPHPYQKLIAQKKYTEALETQIGLWLRNQMDRVLVVLFATPRMVGFYFLAFTIARTPSETLSAGATRRLKSLNLEPNSKITFITLRKNISWIQVFSVTFIALFVGFESILLNLTPQHWDQVFQVIPVFLVATIPAALSATLFEFNFRARVVKRRWVLYLISLIGSALIAVSLNLSGLFLAACVVIAKEIVSSFYWYSTSNVPRGSFLGIQTAALTGLALFISLGTLIYL